MTHSSPPADLAKAHEVDPTLIERAQANAARLVAGLQGDYAPAEEPAHTYAADVAP